MAFGTLATRGAAVSTTSNNSLAATLTATVAVGRILVVSVTSLNIATTDGDTNTHSTVTDSQGNTYTKLYERTNTVAGAAGDGVTISTWYTRVTTQLTTSHSVTVTFSSNVSKKTINLLEVPLTNDTDWKVLVAQIGHGNNSLTAATSGLTSRQYLHYYHGGAQGTDSTKTAPTSFTERFDQRSDATAPAVGNETATYVATNTGQSGAASGWTTTANTLQSAMVSFYEYQFVKQLADTITTAVTTSGAISCTVDLADTIATTTTNTAILTAGENILDFSGTINCTTLTGGSDITGRTTYANESLSQFGELDSGPVITLDAAAKLHGTYGFKIPFTTTNQTGYGDATFTATSNDVYARFYLYVASGYTHTGGWILQAITNDWGTTYGVRLNPNGSNIPNGFVTQVYDGHGVDSSSDVITTGFALDTWMCIEIRSVVGTNGGGELWINGTKVDTRLVGNFTGHTVGRVRFGCEQGAHQNGSYIYFDDCVIDDTYIGPYISDPPLNLIKGLADTITTSTTETSVLNRVVGLVDTISVTTIETSTLDTTAALNKEFTGTINTTSSTTASAIRVMGLADTIDLTTSTSSVLNRIVGLSDTIDTTITTTSILNRVVGLADTINTTSTNTSSLIRVLGLADTINTSTTNSASAIRVVGLSDTISVATTETSTLSTVGQVALTGTITTTVATTAKATSDIKLSDTISVATTTTGVLQTSAYKEFSDTISVTTSTTGAIVRTVGLTDTLSTTTSTTATVSNVLALSDTISTSTTTNAVLQTSAFKEFSGTVTSATITNAIINRVVNLQDIIETSTTTTAQAVLLKNLSGTFGCSVNNNGGLLLDKSLQGLFSVVTSNISILNLAEALQIINSDLISTVINNREVDSVINNYEFDINIIQ